MIEVNKITEIYSGMYQLILDSPERSQLSNIIDKNYKYVWGVNHIENALEWSQYNHSLFSVSNISPNVRARNLKMEFLIPTDEFCGLIGEINQSFTIIQTNIEPPYYLELDRFEGKAKYQMLKSKIDFLFELDMPSRPDYTPIVSPNYGFLENILQKFNS